MRRSQKTKWTNFLKRGREWHRSCRPFPVTSRAMAVCFYLHAWCVCVWKQYYALSQDYKSKDITPRTKHDKAEVIDEGCFEDPRWFLSIDSSTNIPEHIDSQSLTSFQFLCVCVCACLCLCACGCVFVGCVPCTSIRAYKVLRWLCPTKLIWTLHTMNRHVHVFAVKFASPDRFIMFNTSVFNCRPSCSNLCLPLNIQCKNHT